MNRTFPAGNLDCVVKKLRSVAVERKKIAPARDAWQSILDLALFNPAAHDRLSGLCDKAGFTPGLLKSIISPSLSSGPVPLRALAQQWRCDPSYVTMQVRELEQRGLVERRFNPEDHRFKTVALTDKGDRVRAELLDQLLEPPEFFTALTASEQRTLRDLLRKMSDAASACDPSAQEMTDAG